MKNSSSKQPICLTIAGLDPSGGAGIVADIKTFSRFGCFAAAAISSVTFQNTVGVFGAEHQTADSVRKQVEAVLDDYDVAAVKTGMLPTREIIETVAEIIAERKLTNVVVDPVVRSTSGYDLIDDAALTALIERLFPFATVVTPNLQEAERIARCSIQSPESIGHAAMLIRERGAAAVLMKGGHTFENGSGGVEEKGSKDTPRTAKDFLYIGEKLTIFEAEFIETTATHGTGCTLAAAIAANLALGRDLSEAVSIAKAFVYEAIRTAPMIGHGNSPINI
ncbi:MAG TPA: bifunctional hydroxymethylpyrimidine kinase/phosphomethylpyrimidine kinase [Pyrinomonadaceae bacterium]|nr:bifunctional hydroxymethylpyrimidine kinase/phosphomethylpyrimidine kinase [Pyrinomonadaceae bacterium]